MKHLSVPNATKADRILVVDDAPDNVLLVETILEEEGYEISSADNGFSALSQIDKCPPDLLLLDVMMPGIDGYEVTKRIRQKPELPFIPILLITAHDSASVVQGLDLGADDFIRKPVEMDELLARVRSLLRLKHSVDERNSIALQREDFVSRLAHDLRTPLVAADRMLTLMQQGALGEISLPMRDAFGTMVRSNKNLISMVNMLLEVYRYEAGGKSLSYAAVDLRQLITEVAQELAPLADAKGLSVNLDLTESAESAPIAKYPGDRLELHRLLTNLIGNAIKFTDRGSIDIRLKAANSPAFTSFTNQPLAWVIIEIQDTGPGISPTEQAKLFKRFGPGTHKRSGTGLGLHLCRQIVEAHRGTIEAKSELGKGSLFTIRLPC
ncbi:MAG: hybrid sensor histidine kinase/response regulator [Tychonema bourrellyi B0820]|uniref:histidine kinase n=1 Tax=Tychonema bourrellyi FEM_GT703 TaxID=2040638 RepID=A0A2G4EY61_9CYAN|nr:hybrid sensor histidine kinase/response regulator [Tychonema bourrellyi]MDQ2099135.1 hybrid sensor histidine kinase/response regulator [Tychonema bourrellyi B0820]PHX54426.1 hybrid sensor histidine kinase/response regulator [Tychonema bourrellyi FEM_GT703]